MKPKVLVIALASLFVLQNCRSDKYIPGICFEENILPIFVSKCSNKGCHNSKDKKEDWDLTNYEGIMKGIVAGHPLQSKIYNVIRGKNPEMPLEGSPQLTSHELSLIKSWIQFGAKGSGQCNSSCDTTAYNYNANVAPILSTWCVGCHGSSNAGGGIVLSDYNGVKIAVENGSLLGSINHQPAYIAMPKNSAKLDYCKLKVIKKWIDSGYPNN